MSRRTGGIIGPRPAWTTTATSGIFSLGDVADLKGAAQWPRGPVAPTSLAGTASDGQVRLTWTAPATTHGELTDYEIEYTPASGSPVVLTDTPTSQVPDYSALLTFTKTDYGTEVDALIPGVLEITRGVNQGIYNAATEGGWDTLDTDSPDGTEWAVGWADPCGVASKTYATFYNAVGGQLGNNVVGMELVMRHIATSRIWLVKFLSWTPMSGGGGFSYERREFLGCSAVPSTTRTVTGLANGTEYALRVRGTNHTQGDWSESVTVTPSVGFNPASISGLAGWWDASDASTLYDDTSAGALVGSGGLVARWEDKSGNGRHATQSTSAKRPVRSVAQVNGLDALTFDGTDDKLIYSGPSQSEATIFAVVRKADGVSQYQGLFAFAKTYAIYSRLGSGNWGVYNVTGGQDNPSGITLAAGTTYALTARRTSSNRFLYTNGSLSATVAGDSFSGYADIIGADADNSQVHNGEICELLAYTSSLSDADRGQVESYLMTKWGVT